MSDSDILFEGILIPMNIYGHWVTMSSSSDETSKSEQQMSRGYNCFLVESLFSMNTYIQNVTWTLKVATTSVLYLVAILSRIMASEHNFPFRLQAHSALFYLQQFPSLLAPRAVVLNIKINTATLPIHKNFISQKSPASVCCMSERPTLER